MLRLLASSLLATISSGSFCGDSAIPYSFEVLTDGQPILGCARPTCFGWGSNGQPATTTPGSFYSINEHADGFIRGGPDSIPPYGPTDDRSYRPQAAMCEATFSSSNCAAVNQWVGGVAPLLNVTAYPTVLQCCALDELMRSEDRGIAPLHGGQIVVGGEVLSSGVQVAFDYISDVSKVVRADGSLQYDVSVRRMPCADHSGLPDAYKINKPEGPAQAFQAPNVAVNQPLPLPGQNAVLEEVVQQEAIQLPANTQFQTMLQPPPFQQPLVQQYQPQYVPQAAPQQYYAQPAYYGGGGGDAQWCFSGDMTVEMQDGSRKRMDELKKMDWVLTANEDQLEYVPIDYWLHRVPDQVATFNEFELADGSTIKLTDKHYIFKGDCSRVSSSLVPYSTMPQKAVTADRVRVGDCLFTLRDDRQMHELRVVRAEKVTQRGIYAPMTANGRIIVNGVHASCHNIMQAHSIGHTLFMYVDRFSKICDRMFGPRTDAVIETPTGINTIIAIADLIMPKHVATY